MSGSPSVTATVNSKCAASEPSWVKTDQPSPPTRTSGLPARRHRLDREHHALFQQRPLAGRAEVRHLRLLVHLAADAVADERADDREPGALGDALDRVRDVAHAVARTRALDARVQRRLGPAQQVVGGVLISPTANVRAASATQPSSVTPTSTEMISPRREPVGPGMPCTTSESGEVQIEPGKPR